MKTLGRARRREGGGRAGPEAGVGEGVGGGGGGEGFEEGGEGVERRRPQRLEQAFEELRCAREPSVHPQSMQGVRPH